MNESGKNRALLPSGFADLLPPKAAQEAHNISTLISCFETFGFERVKPPLVEFEDSLFAPGPGESLADHTFRLMDPLSHKMMGVRSDVTVQIARIASTRLAEEVRPLRLAYANDVLRTRGSHQRTQRQFCQVGCEIIGAQDLDADIEVCVVALSGLAALGVGELSIDLSYPTLAARLFDLYDVDASVRLAAVDAITRRDFAAIGGLENAALARSLMGLIYAAGPAGQAIQDLRAVPLECGEAVEDIKKLCTVYEGIAQALAVLDIEAQITIDPVEGKGLGYYSGVGFSLFSGGVRAELGGGGRYLLPARADGARESASGFTLYMDTVCKVTPSLSGRESVFVDADESWGVVGALQKEGWIVVRGARQDGAPARCTHIYENGEIKKKD